MKNLRLLLSILLCFGGHWVWGVDHISLVLEEDLLEQSVSRMAVEDVRDLLGQACNCRVDLNDREAEIVLELLVEEDLEGSREVEEVPTMYYPMHDYVWKSKKEGEQTVLQLETASYMGLSCGLYGLLQEQLGFSFYHPKESIIPSWTNWPLAANFVWEARARFQKKGFHIHTMHPIELTEPLLNPKYPNAMEEVKRYIDWLARNQQNYFEFNLLESIKRKRWIEHAKEIVAYGHDRGMIMGLDISLHMIQQKAFMLYEAPLKSFKKKEAQIAANVEWLMQADFDVLNVEFSTTEFSFGNQERVQELQLFLNDLLVYKYGKKLMGRKHVVREEEQAIKRKKMPPPLEGKAKALDAKRGELIHTVMFYTISEEHAPVYQNDNLRHMLKQFHEAREVRETWYFPESAYWITFDNSVPMYLLSYLTARLDDILVMDSLGTEGHITFSSGWEWGYWLFDWSIARWSWEHSWNGMKVENRAIDYVGDLFYKSPEVVALIEANRQLQDDYLKGQNVMQYMTAMTITDEFPGKLRFQLHPRPEWTLKQMRKKIDAKTILQIKKEGIIPLLEMAAKMQLNVADLKRAGSGLQGKRKRVFEEMVRGLEINAMRAQHRAYVLGYLLSKRKADLKKEETLVEEELLQKARAIRGSAQELVYEQERVYRYDVNDLGRKHRSKTAYAYGYLYPVSQLHFWEREELQAEKDKFRPFYRNIWNVPKIIGLWD